MASFVPSGDHTGPSVGPTEPVNEEGRHVKSPNVMRFSGHVTNSRIGRTRALSKPKTTARISAVVQESILTTCHSRGRMR